MEKFVKRTPPCRTCMPHLFELDRICQKEVLFHQIDLFAEIFYKTPKCQEELRALKTEIDNIITKPCGEDYKYHVQIINGNEVRLPIPQGECPRSK